MRTSRTPRRKARADFLECLENRLLMARLTGIDVSHFQGVMDWNVAASRGLDFAFIRGSRTDTLPDNQLANNMHPTSGAKAKGLVVGVYHRILPFGNVSDIRQDAGEPTDANYIEPEVDAQNYWNSAGQYMNKGYIRPVVDVENGASLNTTPHVNAGGTPTPTTNLSQWVLRWVAKLKELYTANRGGAQITPIIYTGHYRSNLNSTVVSTLPDLWIANWNQTSYGDPVNGTGGPPTSPWNPTPNWKFWQYDSPNGLGSFYGAKSTDIDLNVFNGDNINILKQNFVIGAASIPSAPSPANNATNVSPTVTLNWADSANATAYDVYVDGVLRASNITQSQWTVSPALSGGQTHTWRVVAKGVVGDDDTHTTTVNNWSFTTAALPLPGVPSSPTPHNVFVINKPVVLDWADTPNASTYDVYLGTNATPTYVNLTASQTPAINPTDGERLWRVVAKNATGSTNGPQWQYTMDATRPSATYGGQTPTGGTTFLDFTITYDDGATGTGVDFTSLDSSDVYVELPGGGGTINATLVDIDADANGPTRIATYRIAAPGGTWDVADNGAYLVHQNAEQVRDIAGGSRPAGQIGTFTVNFAQPFAYQVGATLHVEFDGTAVPIALAPAAPAGTFAATRNGTTLEFSGVTAIAIAGTAADDHLRLGGALPVPLTFDNGAGDDSVTVTSGTYTFASELNATLRNVDLAVDAGATAVFDTTLHLDRLTVTGHAAMLASGSRALVVKDLVIGAAGRLDLSDNDMVIDYDPAAPSPIGGFDGTAYSGVLGLVQRAYNWGAWDQPGIGTSQFDAGPARGLTTLAVGAAAEAFFLGAGDTASFAGVTVDASAVVIKYTYAGDLTFDGVVDGADYGMIDNWSQFPGTAGYVNGDFNYDGVIDGADYGLIDNTVQFQGAPL